MAASGRTSAKNIVQSCRIFVDKALVNGKWSAGSLGKSFVVQSPATQDEIARVPDMNRSDVEAAIRSASSAFKVWKDESFKTRSSLLRKLCDSVASNAEELSTIMTAESGKPYAESHVEVLYAASYLEWFAEEAKRIDGDVLLNTDKKTRRFVAKHPVGVSAMITPWNFPLAMITRKIGAALAAGCSVVIKPSEETPLTALAFAKLADELSFPPGLINVVTCSRDSVVDVGHELATNPIVQKLSFTGSTAAGKWLLEKAAGTVKRVSMELGGSAPFIVFDSANIDVAVNCLLKSKFRNSGQTCVCPDRLFVQSGIHDAFVASLAGAMKKLSTGDPFNKANDVSCLINQRGVSKVEEQQQDACSNGAQIVLGGKKHEAGDLFYEPTLLTNCTPDMLVMKEETFGPLVPIAKFESEDEVLAAANNTAVGLAGYFFTNDQSQMWRIADNLDVGMAGINESAISADYIPFGGVKESGFGREGSKYGIDEYLELKYLCIGDL